MTAVACLRIVIGESLHFTGVDTLAELVARVAGAYLETRWTWPRRHGLVAPFAFALADPRATQLDPRELQVLARELHLRLFGADSDGEVTLLTFEGDQREVMRFASLNDAKLRALMRGEGDELDLGRLCRINRDEIVSLRPAGGPIVGVPTMEALAAEQPPAGVAYGGVYDSRRETFIGSGAIWSDSIADVDYGEPSIDEVLERDLAVLEAAATAVPQAQHTQLFVPISFSILVKPSTNVTFVDALAALPQSVRSRLRAVIYDTPRSPSFQALSAMRKKLAPLLGDLSLRVTDPDFQIDNLPPKLAASVMLDLPEGEDQVRLQALIRFGSQADAYGRKRVLQGVNGLRSRKELQACLKYGIPYLTGPAICAALLSPLEQLVCPVFNLPLNEWSRSNNAPAGDQAEAG
jgi:hypothetical protein